MRETSGEGSQCGPVMAARSRAYHVQKNVAEHAHGRQMFFIRAIHLLQQCVTLRSVGKRERERRREGW